MFPEATGRGGGEGRRLNSASIKTETGQGRGFLMTANIELVSRRFPMLLQDKLPRAKVEMDAVRPEDRVAQKARSVSARYRIQFVH